ncbi:MAG: hypothetical protein ACRC4H_15940 [Plesiomonas sp.]
MRRLLQSEIFSGKALLIAGLDGVNEEKQPVFGLGEVGLGI